MILFLVAMISIGWGIAFISIAMLLQDMAPMQMLAARWTITALIFLLLIVTGRMKLNLKKGKSLVFLFLTGLFEPCAYSILEAYGVKMTSASISAIFVATIPSMTLVLGILFFRHKADARLVLGLLITFAGVVIATVFSPAFSLGGTRMGMLCMMLGVIAASMYSLSSKRASADFDAMTVTAMMAFEGAICFNIIAFLKGYRMETFTILFTDWSIMANMLFLAVFCAFASYLCYNKLLNYVEPALGNNIVSSLSTVVGVVAGIIVMGDLWGWYTIVGMSITLAGVWLSSMRMKTR
ncbi:MAG: DMT family transporter [Bacillota bacterium]|nr:DMT family transporter [Bacillota bacterium]